MAVVVIKQACSLARLALLGLRLHLGIHQVPALCRQLCREDADQHERAEADEQDDVARAVERVAVDHLLREDTEVRVEQVRLERSQKVAEGKGRRP